MAAMTLPDARAMVAQMFPAAPEVQRETIALYMVQTGACAVHVAWELYGRASGVPCLCTPCLEHPPIGSEVAVLMLLGGRRPEEVNPIV